MPNLFFKTNVLLKNLVGKDLINDDNIAVVELIKNAYDAGSKSVLIQFQDFGDETSHSATKLIISDKGSGMDRRDMEDKWLNIAYSDKTTQQGEHGVYYAGNKGVGRFSCDRLGARLHLLTRKKGGDLIHMDIPWTRFEVEGQKDLTIQDIGVDLEVISDAKAAKIAASAMPPHGTVLVIEELRTVWDRGKLLDMKRALEKFLSPNQKFMRDAFRISIDIPNLKKSDKALPETEQINGTVENQIFQKLQFNSSYIESSIDPEGKHVETIVRHDGENVFRLVEKNETSLKNVRAVIYFLNPYKKGYFKRQTGFRSIDFGSVFLFLNGFRIAPYGDRGDDWLGLDVRKTQGTSRYFGSRDLVGRVEVFDDEESFKPISSREGLKKNAAFISLKEDFILAAIKRLEQFVVDGLNWDSIPTSLRDVVRAEEGLDWRKTTEEYSESWDRKRQRIALSIMTLIGSSPDKMVRFWFSPALLEGVYEQRVEETQRLIGEIEGFDSEQVDSALKGTLVRLRKIVADKDNAMALARAEASRLRVAVVHQKERISKLTKEGETFRAQTLFLQSMTSLDVKTLTAFHHEIFLNSTIIDNHIGKIVKALRGIEGTSKAIESVEKLSLANKRITAIAQFATRANFKASSSKELTDIPGFIEQYTLNVARDFVASGISLKVTNAVIEPFEVLARRIELSILIDNIIRNAIKAQATALEVLIAKKSANEITIAFCDNGHGLSDAIKKPDEIFEFGVTTTSGSGLGLYHAREIVNALGGTIRALSRKKGLEILVEIVR